MDSPSFFTAEPLMAAGPGFALYGPGHLVALACCAMGAILLVRGFLRLPAGLQVGQSRRHLLAALAATLVALRVSHDALNVACGMFTPGWWPLHLCNLCELLCLAYAVRPREALGQIVLGLALPCGLLALLFPGWSYCPLLTWASICGFATHAGMVAFALMIACGGEIHPRLRTVWLPLATMLAYALVAYPLNRALGTNFGFVNWPVAGTPLATLADMFGNPGYLAPYLAIMAVLVVCSIALAEQIVASRAR